MASERQLAANRINAPKSTGPITPRGRKKSAQNNRRHCMLARTVLLDGESKQHFLLLLDRLRDHFNPQTLIESTQVELVMEKAGIAHEIRRQSASSERENSNQDDATRTTLAFRALRLATIVDTTIPSPISCAREKNMKIPYEPNFLPISTASISTQTCSQIHRKPQ